MAAAMPFFDTHKYVNSLKAAGFTEKQAEAQSSALVGAFDTYLERLATKDDIRGLKDDLRGLEGKLELQGVEFREKFNHLKWMFGLMMGGIVALVLRVYFPVA